MISDTLKKILLSELELDEFDFQDDTRAFEVPGWDSLNHARIIAAIEDTLKIRFKTSEILKLKNLGDLQALIHRVLPGF